MEYENINTVLSIAGSDCSGGAGIQADIKTILSNGCYAMTAITALTAQNTHDVQGICDTTPKFLENQIRAVCEDILPDAVKIGMVSSAALIHTIAKLLRIYNLKNIVVDPVMVSTSGCKLLSDDAIDILVDELFPLATLITPNIDEAKLLSGDNIETAVDMERVGRKLCSKYQVAVLMKGGHRVCDSNDLLVTKDSFLWFDGVHIDNDNTHGTGCTLSSAIAAQLAKGYSIEESVSRAKLYISQALFYGINLGNGNGPLNHGFLLNALSKQAWSKTAIRRSLALYAITDDYWQADKVLVDNIEHALKGGATMVQLRQKKMDFDQFLSVAKQARELTQAYHVPLIINDNVMVAALVDADGVHLGQEDMDIKKARKILGSHKIIGASAHNVEEAKYAEACGADYIGVGAVFHTRTKDNTIAISLEELQNICRSVRIPAVAIGGINKQNITELAKSGIAGVALVSAIFSAEDIEKETDYLYKQVITII